MLMGQLREALAYQHTKQLLTHEARRHLNAHQLPLHFPLHS